MRTYAKILRALAVMATSLMFSATAMAGCLTGQMSTNGSGNNWYTPIVMTIKNTCGTPQSLAGMKISFSNPSGTGANSIGSVWGEYSGSNFSQTGFTLVNSSGKSDLAANSGSATIQFGVNTNGTAFNIANANTSLMIGDSSAGSSSSGSGTTVPPEQVIETPAPAGCLAGTLVLGDPKNLWYTSASLKIVNNCGAAQNLNGAVVSFSGSNINSVQGPYYPFQGTDAKVSNGAISFTLSSQNAQANQLANTASVTLTSIGFNMSNKTALPGGVGTYPVSIIPAGFAGPTPDNGVITLNINPAGVTGLSAGTAANITISSNALAQPIVYSNSNWTNASTKTFSGLGYATYTVTADDPKGYLGVTNPTTITLGNSTPAVINVTYKVAPAVGNISVTLPTKPIGSLTDTGMTVNLTDITHSAGSASKFVGFNQTVTFNNLPAGDTYQVSTIPIAESDGIQTATPTFSVNNFKLVANTTQAVTVGFQLATNPTTPVAFNVSGLTSSVPNLTLTLTNLQGTRVSYSLANGSITKQLPANNTYTPDVNASPLVGNISPSVISTMSGNVTTPVTINVGAAPAFVPQLGAYWAGWMGYQYDLNNTYGNIPLTNIFLSFANYSNGKIDTSVSGWFGDVPAANSQIQPTYQNWTTYAYNHPNVKMMLSLGGASFGAMWSNLNSDQAAQNMATAIINMLKTNYPVYAPAGSNPQVAYAINSSTVSTNTAYGNSRLLGYVQMGGVDFDVEVSGAQQMAAMTPYLVKVVNAVHSALPNKAITFATFSVAADPANACTVPGSAHCGEALPLIKAINAAGLKNYVTYNVMAYDAGTDFVLSTTANGGVPLYQKAMQNYVNAVGDSSKVVLGLDLQGQWGLSAPLTCAQLASEAQWAYQHPSLAGGTFLWEIGDDSNACKALPALQGMAAAMPK